MSHFSRIIPFIRSLAPFLMDPSVTEIMVIKGGRAVFVERAGRLEVVSGLVLNEENLTVAIQSIARSLDVEIDERQPILDARLEDGSRVAAVLRPSSADGPTFTIRKFTHRYTLAELVEAGSLPASVSDLLVRAVVGQQNILISGGTSTGKTTLLNALAAAIPETDRIVLIEDTSEISIDKPHLVRFEARRDQSDQDDPMPEVTIAQLLRATLRQRPDRILLGEVRGAEAWDLLQALNTGHDGSCSTIHANTARQALTRMTFCVLMADMGLPLPSIKEAIALAIHLVVHIDRIQGRRVVSEVIAVDTPGYDAKTDQFKCTPLYQRQMETGVCV